MPDKSCFIIMPITTPEHMVKIYGDDTDHFKNVLTGVFIPAVEEAGLVPIPPIAEGSDIIQANIIKNLETADLVLCDMSCLNPNVFFEVGIRTALNKPVCMVKDDQTPKVPFDTHIINFHEYLSAPQWQLEDERTKLTSHIEKSLETSEESNTLWKYFGISTIGRPDQIKDPTAFRLDLILMELFGMKNQITSLETEALKKQTVLDRLSRLPVRDFTRESIAQAFDDEGSTTQTFFPFSPNDRIQGAMRPDYSQGAMSLARPKERTAMDPNLSLRREFHQETVGNPNEDTSKKDR